MCSGSVGRLHTVYAVYLLFAFYSPHVRDVTEMVCEASERTSERTRGRALVYHVVRLSVFRVNLKRTSKRTSSGLDTPPVTVISLTVDEERRTHENNYHRSGSPVGNGCTCPCWWADARITPVRLLLHIQWTPDVLLCQLEND